MKNTKMVTFGWSNGRIRSGPTPLTGQRPVLEMTSTFRPVRAESAAVVIERGGPYRKSLQKVFPFWCHSGVKNGVINRQSRHV